MPDVAAMISFHEGTLGAPARDDGISKAEAEKLRARGEWVATQVVVDGEVRTIADHGKDLDIRWFDAQRRMVRRHRFIRVDARLMLDWVEEQEYDERTGGVVRSRSWRLFPTGELSIGANDLERRVAGDAELEGQDVTPFLTAEPAFGDYAALLAFRPAMPAPPLRWRQTG